VIASHSQPFSSTCSVTRRIAFEFVSWSY
jgi:hypothetical protein